MHRTARVFSCILVSACFSTQAMAKLPATSVKPAMPAKPSAAVLALSIKDVRPLIQPSPMLQTAQQKGSMTTLSTNFSRWFGKAVTVARSTWSMPKLSNMYGDAVTEDAYIRAIVYIESAGIHGGPGKINTSSSGALGFMQLLPGTGRDMGVDAKDPEQNLMGGVKYLAVCFKSKGTQVSGDCLADKLAKAAAAYNSGPASKNLLKPWSSYVGTGYEETTEYGIKLKMALALPLSTKEKGWMAKKHKQDLKWVDWYARLVFIYSQGLTKSEMTAQAS